MPDDEIVLPALLRAARTAYGQSVRASLAAAGFDDLPPNGAFVLGGLANHGATAGDLIKQLGVSKQATSQLVDTLVLRGYLEREPDTDDRRRMTITVTERGRAAAAAVRAGVVAVDEELDKILSPDELLGLRAGLMALIQIAEQTREA
jgi:DNA-binding MarR family transcriptional regulator